MPKCSLSTFAKSVDLFIETLFTISSLLQGVLLLRDVKFICSLPGVFRIIFVFSK